MSGVRAILAAAILVSPAACETIEPRIPAVELPDTSGPVVPGIERWWTQFNDPQLNALIDEALAANLDLRTSVARIEEARASLRFVRANLYPTVDAQINASRGRRSEAIEPSFPGPTITNSYAAGVVAAYEVDLWGRLLRRAALRRRTCSRRSTVRRPSAQCWRRRWYRPT